MTVGRDSSALAGGLTCQVSLHQRTNPLLARRLGHSARRPPRRRRATHHPPEAHRIHASRSAADAAWSIHSSPCFAPGVRTLKA